MTVPEKKHAIKAYGGVELYLQVFLTMSLDGIEWYAEHTSRFTRAENFPGRYILWRRIFFLNFSTFCI